MERYAFQKIEEKWQGNPLTNSVENKNSVKKFNEK